MIRSIAPGCPSLLENADDTNNSAADFSEVAPNPRSNASAIEEAACPSVLAPVATPTATPTAFDLKAAIKKCKKKFPKGPKRKKCIRKAKQKAAAS